MEVKTSISAVIKSTAKDSTEIRSFAFRSVHLIQGLCFLAPEAVYWVIARKLKYFK